MSAFKLLFLLFLLLPLLELYVLLQTGEFLGTVPTVVLVIFTAALGAVLLRIQGLQSIATVQHKLRAGEIPAIELLAGVMLLLCGALLLTPGFVTDAIGFTLLIPAVRRLIAWRSLRYVAGRGSNRPADAAVIIEGEYAETDERHSKAGITHASKPAANG